MRLEAVVLHPAIACAASLFAQGEQVPGWLSPLIQAGSFGVLTYLIVYGLPQLQRQITSERKAERDDYAKTVREMTDDRGKERLDFANALKVVTDFCRGEVEAVRSVARAEVETLRNAFAAEQKETRAYYARETEAMRKLYIDSVSAMRTAVHDVRDTAQATVNKANIAIETSRQQQRDSA